MSSSAAQRERLARWLLAAGGSGALAAAVRAGRAPGGELGYDDRRLWLEGAIGDLRHQRLDEGSVERVERLGLALGFSSENVEGLVLEVFTFPLERLRAYAALGLPIGASPEEIKATHRVIAKALHPDRLQAADAEARRAAEQLLGRVNHARSTLLATPVEPDPEPPAAVFRAAPEPVETERIPRPPRRPAPEASMPPAPPPALFFGDEPPTLVPDEADEVDPDEPADGLPDEARRVADDDEVPLAEPSLELPAAEGWIELDPPSEPGFDAPPAPTRRRAASEPSVRLPMPEGIEPETELELEPVALPEGVPIPDTDISDLLEEVAGPRRAGRPPRGPAAR